MRRVSAADVVRYFSALSDEALINPIVVTKNGRDRLVLVSVEYMKELLELDGSSELTRAESQMSRDTRARAA